MVSSEQEIKTSSSSSSSSAFCPSSSSSSSRSSSSSSTLLPQPPKRRSMDEVWKDIALSPTLHYPAASAPAATRALPVSFTSTRHRGPAAAATPFSSSSSSSSCFRGIVFQDFLAGAFADDVPRRPPSPALLFRTPPPIPHHPPTALSLNSNSDVVTGDCACFAAAARPPPPPELFSHSARNRALIEPHQSDDGFGRGGRSRAHHRHSRMIKNRESAARSRARKQAYTQELELEVARLLDENSKLKKKYDELRLAMASQLPSKRRLQRTSTAPF